MKSEMMKKIEDFVYSKPRSIQEIAKHIGKNWRTADRYIEEIRENHGTISSRVFREGTRGAIKIVYWSAVDKISNSIFQEQIEREIFSHKTKESFSAFDIFQHVDDKHKKVSFEIADNENETDIVQFKDFVLSAKKQILFFSGNLSFLNISTNGIDMFKVIEELVRKKISIKVLCRVDLVGRDNIEKILSLNYKYGEELVEVHHFEHPIRAVIVDSREFRIKEIKEPSSRTNELNKRIYLFYSINDRDWSEWLTKIFWKMFSSSLNANKRIEEMNKIKFK